MFRFTFTFGLRCQCYGDTRRHSSDNISNDTYTRTRHVTLAKHRLWLPDDCLCKPKHVAAACMILIVLII
jgi:hypothetical protein